MIAVLWVVVLAGMILLGVSTESRVHSAAAENELGAVQALWLARAGVEQAMAILEDDDPAVDSPDDDWYHDPLLLKEVSLGGGSFSVVGPAISDQRPTEPRFGLIDHNSRADINLLDANQLRRLSEDLKDEQIAAILDWRDGDDTGRPGGAEQGYYQSLPFPYLIRNGPLRTIRELLLVRGIDPKAFFGEDVNENGRLDPGEDDGEASWPPDDADGKLDLGLAGLATIYSYELNKDALGDPRVNLNSADQQTLMNRLGLGEPLAKAIVERRGSSRLRRVVDIANLAPSSGRGPSEGGPGPRGGPSAGPGRGPSEGPAPADRESPEGERTSTITLKWLADHWDQLTISDDERLPGRINVNTAERAVLMTLPEMNDAAADAIVNRRQSQDGAFRSVGELLSNGILQDKQFQAMADLLTVRSTVFEIRSTGVTSTGIRKTLVAIVDRGATPMSVLYWYQSE